MKNGADAQPSNACEVRGSAGGVADLRMLMRNQPRLMCNFENMLRTYTCLF